MTTTKDQLSPREILAKYADRYVLDNVIYEKDKIIPIENAAFNILHIVVMDLEEDDRMYFSIPNEVTSDGCSIYRLATTMDSIFRSVADWILEKEEEKQVAP